jgi:nitrogen fixation NifU-like protein
MSDADKVKPSAHPLTFFQNLTEAEQMAAERPPQRFSATALRAAFYPRHLGEMDQPDGASRTEGSCGDLMSFYLRIESDCLTQVTFTTDGCDATIASGEMLATMVMGLSLQEAERITPQDLLMALDGLPPNHVHCASLAVGTLREALADYRNRSEA